MDNDDVKQAKKEKYLQEENRDEFDVEETIKPNRHRLNAVCRIPEAYKKMTTL